MLKNIFVLFLKIRIYKELILPGHSSGNRTIDFSEVPLDSGSL